MTSTTNPGTTRGLLVPVLTLALLAAPAGVRALDEDQQQPLYLEADAADLDDPKAVSIYTGNVFIRQGSMEIRGDQVTVLHDEKRKPKHMTAVGEPAKYRQQMEGEEQEVEAEALRMEYDAAKDEITLVGEALLFQGQDTFRSDRIVYDRARGQVKAGASASGSERVRITINPAQQ